MLRVSTAFWFNFMGTLLQCVGSSKPVHIEGPLRETYSKHKKRKTAIIFSMFHNIVQSTLTHFTHRLPTPQPFIQALLMTGNQLRHTGHTLPCPLCQVTLPKSANERGPWVHSVCVWVIHWVKEKERVICRVSIESMFVCGLSLT